MKGLREFLVFDCEAFFKDKRLSYLSHSHWHEYADGKKTDNVLGTVIEVVIGDDNTKYNNPDTSNIFDKLKVKVPLSFDEVNRLGLKKLQVITFQGLRGRVYGNYSDSLSLQAEGVDLVINKKD